MCRNSCMLLCSPSTICSIQRSIVRSVLLFLVTSLMQSHVDYEVQLWRSFPNTCRTICSWSSMQQQHVSFVSFVSSQVRPRVCVSTASGTVLAFCSWMHQILTGHTRVLLPAQNGSIVPGKRPLGRQHILLMTSPFVIKSATDHFGSQSFQCQWLLSVPLLLVSGRLCTIFAGGYSRVSVNFVL